MNKNTIDSKTAIFQSGRQTKDTYKNYNMYTGQPLKAIKDVINKIFLRKIQMEIEQSKQVVYYDDSDEQNYQLPLLQQEYNHQLNMFQHFQKGQGQIHSQMRTRIIQDKKHSMNRAINDIKEQLCNLEGNHQSSHQKAGWVINQKQKQKIKMFFQEYSRAEEQHQPKRKSLRQYSRQSNIPYSSLNRLFSKWRQDPTLLNLESNQKKKERKMSVTVLRTQRILNILELNPYFTANEIEEQLLKNEDCLRIAKNGQLKRYINAKSIYKILHRQNFAFKRIQRVPTVRNTEQNILHRSTYCQRIKQILSNKHNILFYLDSTSINMYFKREKAWGKKGEQLLMKVLNAKGKNIYIITLIGKEGFVRSQLILGTINKKQFFLILSKIFNQILTTRRSQAKFLVMDNCFLHGKQDVIEFAEHNNFDVIFLPPYSPQLNPVELYFHELKSAIRKQQFQTERQLIKTTQLVLEQFKSKRMENYYNHVDKYICRGIQKQSF